MFLLYIYVTEEQFTAHFINCGQVSQADLKLFFESICGEVYRLRVLGDCQHSTRIAFVEFVMAESATAALNCSGVVLGSMPLRIKPLKDSSCARVHLSVPCALIFESSRRWLTAVYIHAYRYLRFLEHWGFDIYPRSGTKTFRVFLRNKIFGLPRSF